MMGGSNRSIEREQGKELKEKEHGKGNGEK